VHGLPPCHFTDILHHSLPPSYFTCTFPSLCLYHTWISPLAVLHTTTAVLPRLVFFFTGIATLLLVFCIDSGATMYSCLYPSIIHFMPDANAISLVPVHCLRTAQQTHACSTALPIADVIRGCAVVPHFRTRRRQPTPARNRHSMLPFLRPIPSSRRAIASGT